MKKKRNNSLKKPTFLESFFNTWIILITCVICGAICSGISAEMDQLLSVLIKILPK